MCNLLVNICRLPKQRDAQADTLLLEHAETEGGEIKGVEAKVFGVTSLIKASGMRTERQNHREAAVLHYPWQCCVEGRSWGDWSRDTSKGRQLLGVAERCGDDKGRRTTKWDSKVLPGSF